MATKKLFHVLFIPAVLASFAGCKPGVGDSSARVKTLDSIASGVLDIDANQCKGTGLSSINDSEIVFDKTDVVKISEADKSKIRVAVKDYFSALPQSAQDLFLKLGGQVMISSKVDQLCSSAHYGRKLDASQGEVTEGCFHFVNDSTGNKAPIFTIVHSPDAKKIRYYGPQIFGYIYAQFYSRLTLAANGKGLVIAERESMQLISHKEKVANAFLTDMLASKQYKIDVLKNLIGSNSASELASTSIASPIDRLSLLKDDQRRSQFLDYVYANSFQSAHCNEHSLAVAKSHFKKSSELFVEIDNSVLEISSALLGVRAPQHRTSAAASNSSFALAGDDILSSVMPLLGNLQGLLGGAGGGGADLGNLSSMFTSLLSGAGGGDLSGTLQSALGSAGGLKDMFGNLFSSLSAAGCDSGSCSGCGGSCSGGSCSCSSGGCSGGCSGSCSCCS